MPFDPVLITAGLEEASVPATPSRYISTAVTLMAAGLLIVSSLKSVVPKPSLKTLFPLTLTATSGVIE